MARAAFLTFLLAGLALAQQFSGWTLTKDSQAAGYTLAFSLAGDASVAAITPTRSAPPNAGGSITATLTAGSIRGHAAHFKAWLRIVNPGPDRKARLWIQAERPNAVNDPLDNLTSKAVKSDEWTLTEVTIGVAADANAIVLGVAAEGGAAVEVRGESLNNVALPMLETPRLELPEESGAAADDFPSPEPALMPEPPTVTDLLPLDLPEKQRTIQAAARTASQYVRNLPDFLCTETIRRAENQQHRGWKQRDVLSIRLGYSGGIEHYLLVTVNGKPSSAPLESLKGGIAAGEFGSLLGEVFTPHMAGFAWDRWALLRGRTVAVFQYKVTADKSKFHLRFDDGTGPLQDTISAYHGSVYIDRETNEVLRLVEIADPPDGFPLRESIQALDYDHTDVGGQQFLLPVRSESFIGSATLTSRNVIEFHDYQKFSAEVKIQFE